MPRSKNHKPGKRVFSIAIGSYTAYSNLDLVVVAGKNAAYDVFIEFTLLSGNVYIGGNLISGAFSGGVLNVRFIPIIDNAKIAGLLLIKGNCAIADNCNQCYTDRCAVWNNPTLTCNTCIANAQKVSGVCTCGTNAYWVYTTRTCDKCDNLCNVCTGSINFLCTTCVSPNVLVSSVCLRACPYGFGSPCTSVSTAVIDQNFANYFLGIYGLFQTGTSSSSYQFFITPETVDPIPAKSRGLYFSGGSYLQASAVYISLNFSIGFWVLILSGSGDILTKNKITISANGVLTIILESRLEATTTVTTPALNPSNLAWAYISFTSSFSSSTISTTITPYLNNSPQTSITTNQYIYRDEINNKIILGKSSSTNFLGYIYQFTLWNAAVSNFNTQYSDQICGTLSYANCLWTCPLSQWMDGATPTNCNSCTNGCVRSGSCNVCFDPLCSKCTGFLTGLCTQCVSNASGTPCTCNAGYVASTDGFSCVQCFTGCASCTGGLYYQYSSFSSSYYLLKTMCLTYCPTGYTADSSGHACTLSASNPLSISLQNLIQLDTVSGLSVGSSNSNKYPSWEVTDPIPSIYRGYYFSGNNYMSLASFTISPYFSLLIWVKPLSDGYLFMKFDGTTKYSYINFASGISGINLRLSDSTSVSISSSPSLSSSWHYIAFTGGLTSGQTVLTRSIDGGTPTSTTSASSAYYKDLGTLYIGKDSTASGGFTGFLWSFKIYNDNTYTSQEWITSGCPGCTACPSELKCPDSCPFGQFYSSSCVSCEGSCPYGCRSTLTCRLCKDKECLACTAFDGSCTSCITNASISGTTCVCNNNAFWEQSSDGCQICDNLCTQCQTNQYFLCTTCGSYYLVSNICLRACPYGFTSPCVIVTSPVIDATFNGDFQGTYTGFITGTSTSFYQFFNSPEAVDPIPAKQRGLYFKGSQYLISSDNIYLSHSFSMGFWTYVISSGDILSNSIITVESSGSIKITLESPSETASSQTLSSTPFTMWKYLSFACSFDNPTVITTLTVYNNNVSVASSTYNTLIYRDQVNQKIKIGGSSSSYFTGFIYKYQLWNVAISDFSAQLNEICGSGLLATCLWGCDISKYWYSAACHSCDSTCTLGCTRSGSCNICDDPLCSVCAGFDANKCTTCVSHAHGSPCSCDLDYYSSPDGFSCLPCFTGCSICTSSHYNQCSACDSTYYFLNVICDTQCPTGYSQNTGTNKCDLVNSLVVDLELDDYIVLDTLSGFNVGNLNTNVYPVIDSNDPIPSISRGYYFTGQSHMTSSLIFSPYFSIMLWVKVIDQGVLIEKYYGASQYLVVKTDSSGYPNFNLLLKDGSSLNAATLQNLFFDWHYLSFSGSINADGTYSSYSYIDSFLLKTVTSISKTYLRDSITGTLLIGFDNAPQTGFKGFLWSLKIYNDETHANSDWTTTTCTANPCTSCPIGDFCPSSCSLTNYPDSTACDPCKTSCSNGCRSNLACTLCREKECYKCTSFTQKCLSCITNAGFVGDSCQCNLNAYWNGSTETCDLCHTICSICSGPSFTECIQCGTSLFMLSNICLEFCPSGYSVAGNQCNLSNDLVFGLRLSQIKDTVYDSIGNVAFQTGNDNNFYPFYTAEDPYAAELRGYYFRGTSFMKSIDSPPSLTFGAEFTIAAWINPTSNTGYIFSKYDSSLSNFIVFSLISGKLNFLIKLQDGTTVSYASTSLSVTLGSWNFIAVKSIISSTPQQKISFYVDSYSEISLDLAASWYQDISSSFSIAIGADANSNTNFYTGFLWNINIYNIDEPLSSMVTSGTCSGCSFCPIELSNECIPNCDLSHYPAGSSCASCQAQCTWGCVRPDKNCNLCQDVICLICDDYASTCITCREHAYLSSSTCVCYDGYYWNSANEECTLCDYTCKTCTSSAPGDCIICASGFYMYLGWCISKCPDGYIEKGSLCMEKDPFIFYLSFNTLEGVVFDQKSKIPALTGNSTAFYPDYDPFDPLAASYRGFYFNGISSIMHLPIYPNYSSPVLSFGYSFTFSIWINIESGFGTIISKQDSLYKPIFSLQLASGVVMISLNFKAPGLNYFFYLQSLESYLWNHIAFSAEYTSLKNTKMAFYLNGAEDHQVDFGSDYFKDTKTDFTFTLGAEIGSLGYSNYFKGFIYDIKGYNSVKIISSLSLPAAQCTENCKACLTTGVCIPNCQINQYLVGPEYNKCSKCSSECSSCKDSSKFCNLCDNPKCASCSDYTADSCLECISGTSNTTNCQCDYGLAWNSSSGICAMCHQWQYKANDSCYDCPPLCAQCDNETKCTWCINNATLQSGSCTCSPGYIGTTTCTYNQTIPSWSVDYISNNEYLISCNFGGGISKGTLVSVYFLDHTAVISISGGVIRDNYLAGSLYQSAMTSEQQEIAKIQNQVSSGAKILVGSSVALVMFNPNPSGLWTMLNTIQLLSYIPYANYPLTDKISAFFKSMNDFNFVPNLFLLFIAENQGNTPYYQAKKYGYDSDLILVNVGNDVTILFGLISLIPLVYYISKCSQRVIGKKLKKIYDDYKFGTFLRFWILNYLEVGFAAIIGILSVENSEIFDSPTKLTNYLLCWFFIVVMIITPLLHSYFSFKNISKIINKRNRKWLIPWNSLYYEFKNDLGFMSTQYYTLFFIRQLIFIAVQVFLIDYPQSQLTINTVASLCIALFVFVYKPFEDTIIQLTNLITECGISITFMLLSPYFFDLGSSGLDAMDSVIMIFVVSLMMVQSAGPFINSLKELYYAVKRNFGKDLRSNPIKLATKTKRIDLNNLGDFFGNETTANVGENQHFTQISTPN